MVSNLLDCPRRVARNPAWHCSFNSKNSRDLRPRGSDTYLKGANVRRGAGVRPRRVEAVEVREHDAFADAGAGRPNVERGIDESRIRIDAVRFLPCALKIRERAIGRAVVPVRGVLPARDPA